MQVSSETRRDGRRPPRRFLRDNGLSLTVFALFLITVVGQALTGLHEHNADQQAHGGPPLELRCVSRKRPFHRSHRGELGERVPADGRVRAAHSVPVPARLLRVEEARRARGRGSRSAARRRKNRDRHGRCGAAASSCESTRIRCRWPSCFCSCSRSALHAVGGTRLYSEEQLEHGGSAVTAMRVPRQRRSSGSNRFRTGRASSCRSPRWWFSIFLRQRGSPESKPVDAPNEQTGNE